MTTPNFEKSLMPLVFLDDLIDQTIWTASTLNLLIELCSKILSIHGAFKIKISMRNLEEIAM